MTSGWDSKSYLGIALEEGTKLFGFILAVEENLKTYPFLITRILPINGSNRGKTGK